MIAIGVVVTAVARSLDSDNSPNPRQGLQPAWCESRVRATTPTKTALIDYAPRCLSKARTYPVRPRSKARSPYGTRVERVKRATFRKGSALKRHRASPDNPL